MTTRNAISWPEKYLPGTGDNFVSDEVIVQGGTAAQVWRYLIDTSPARAARRPGRRAPRVGPDTGAHPVS